MASTLADMASAEEYGDTSSSTSEGGPPIRWRLVVKRLFQLVHLLIAASFLMLGLVEFGVEHSIFDIFGKRGDERSVIPKHVFQVLRATRACSGGVTD